LVSLLKKNNHGIIFYISLDGPEKIHDKFRRTNGCFEKTANSIHKLLEIGCDVRINTSVGKHNATYIGEFMEYVRKEFGVLHRLTPIRPIGRAQKSNLSISDIQFSELLVGQKEKFMFLDNHDNGLEEDWQTPACGVGHSMIFIDAYGDVSVCSMLTQEQNPKFFAGNIFQSSIKEIWENSEIFNEIRNIQCGEIHDCNFKHLCRGGCRSNAYLNSGDLRSPDRQMCIFYGGKVAQ
jgi:radical SAM protein with 4Fe4S-binding SPASM domain